MTAKSPLDKPRMSAPSNWYEDFFHGVTLDLWRQAIPPKQTKAEADFLVKTLHCQAGAHVLDVPCGNGRLSFELARRGLSVTGLDISEEFIAEARASITQTVNQSDDAGNSGASPDFVAPDFILGDKRAIEGEHIYDGAFCFGNSFGFLEYDDMETFLKGMARALKPGSRFIVETAMAAESFLPDFEEQTCHQVGDITLTTKERYNAAEGCIDSEYILERDGQSESRLAKHWIYTAAEIQRMLRRAGFEVLGLYGSLKFEPFKLGSQELFVVSEAVAEPRP
ncbi:MAG TPA: methyltransferase domain-containing protein [Pyrinomonadaceae bacterium]|nr:methyltransferase domain-containing protein [Pyrinomonadaceae bacterium]